MCPIGLAPVTISLSTIPGTGLEAQDYMAHAEHILINMDVERSRLLP